MCGQRLCDRTQRRRSRHLRLLRTRGQPGLQFHPLAPCRGSCGGIEELQDSARRCCTRSRCDCPSFEPVPAGHYQSQAYSFNVTVVPSNTRTKNKKKKKNVVVVLLLRRRSLGLAETVFQSAAQGSGPIAMQARWALAELLLWEGRLDEMRRLLREIGASGRSRDRVAALREHWRLDSVIVAAEEVQPVLDQAARTAPDDDRRLAGPRAPRHAIRPLRRGASTGWTVAQSRHRRCSPGSSRRARLQWALAAGKPEEARRALAEIPAERFDAGGAPGRSAPGSPRSAATPRPSDRPSSSSSRSSPATPRRSIAWRRWRMQAGDRRSRRGDPPPPGGGPPRQGALPPAHDRGSRPDPPRTSCTSAPGWPSGWAAGSRREGWLTLALERDPDDRDAREALDRLARDRTTRPPAPPGRRCSTVARLRRSRPPPRRRGAGHGRTGRSAAIAFRDDAEPAGLRFTYDNGETPQHQLPETIGGGVGLLDYDGDGWLDVYVVQGGPFPPGPTDRRPTRRPPVPQPGRRHVRGRRPTASGIARDRPAATATAWPSATTTTTAAPTCSSPAGGRTPSTATGATARSRTSTDARRPGRRPRLADLGRLRRPRRRRRPRPLRLPLPGLGRRASHALPRPRARRPSRLLPAARVPRACPTTSSATTAADSST